MPLQLGNHVIFKKRFYIPGRSYPFRVGVVFDDSEICTDEDAAKDCETDNVPGGIVGFAIGYEQMSC